MGDGVDAYGTVWFYWWIRTCMAHGGDPSYTNLFYFPDGKDIFAHTGNNFVDAVLAAPLGWLFGSVASSPIFAGVILFGNAVFFRELARRWFPDAKSLFAATLLFEVNPYVL